MAKFFDGDFRIQLGPDDADFGILHFQFSEYFLGNVDHPVDTAIAACHAAAAENDGNAEPLASLLRRPNLRLGRRKSPRSIQHRPA